MPGLGFKLNVSTESQTFLRGTRWNPLTDDGDALRLAVKMGLEVGFEGDNFVFADGTCSEFLTPDPYAATRRAIVRAAAEIGRAM